MALATPSPGMQLSPSALSAGSSSLASLGNLLWDAGQKTADSLRAGIDHLVKPPPSHNTEHSTTREQASQSNQLVSEMDDEKIGIEELMRREELKSKTSLNSRPRDVKLHSLRVKLKWDDATAYSKALDNLDPVLPSSLDTAVGLLATGGALTFLRPDGTSHELSGWSLEALRLGSEDLKERIKELGPVVAYYSERRNGDETPPAFLYDMRRFYEPGKTLNPAQMSSLLAASQNNDSLEFFRHHLPVLKDLLKGFSAGAFLTPDKYLPKGDRQGGLTKKFVNRGHQAEEIVTGLVNSDFKRKAHNLILAEFLGQSTNQITRTIDINENTINSWRKDMLQFLSDSLGSTDSPVGDLAVAVTLQSEMKEEKKRIEKYFKQQEDTVLNSLVGEGKPFGSLEEARAATLRGKKWLIRNWAPRSDTDKHERVGDLRRFQKEVLVEVVYAPTPRVTGSRAKPKRVSLTADEFAAIVAFHRSMHGLELKGVVLAPLYKTLRSLGPLMELRNLGDRSPSKVSQFIWVSDFFRIFFEKTWKSSQKQTIERDLMKGARGRERLYYKQAKSRVSDIIRQGLEQMRIEQRL